MSSRAQGVAIICIASMSLLLPKMQIVFGGFQLPDRGDGDDDGDDDGEIGGAEVIASESGAADGAVGGTTDNAEQTR